MQPVVRSTLVGLLAIASLTACGDKVQVAGPTSAQIDATVHAVTVSPPSVNMQVGQTVTLAASVDAGPGVTVRTVTWSSSNTVVVTVDGTGAVKAVGPGTATVLAAATADPNVKGASVITVGGGGTPTISIASTNTTTCASAGGQCSSVPADLTDFGTGGNIGNTGQLDVTVNVDANGSTLKSVQGTLTCGGNKQTSQQLLSVAPAAGADENAAPVALTFPTAHFNATTGVPDLFNTGQFNVKDQTTPACSLQVSVTPTSGPNVNASAVSVNLNNTDVAIISTTRSGSTASDVNGLPWVSGDITVAVTPVLYSQRTATSLLITLPGANGQSQTVAFSATGATSAKWANDGNAANNVAQLTLNNTDPQGFPSGIQPSVQVIDNAGNTASLAQGNPTSQSNFRIDNQSPQPPTTFNVPQSQGQWVNAAYTFQVTGSTAPAAGDFRYVSCGDGPAHTAVAPSVCNTSAGVSSGPISAAGGNANTTIQFFAFDAGTAQAAGQSVPSALTGGTATSCTNTTTANGWIDVTANAAPINGTGFEGLVNTRYIVRAIEKDKLGNIRCTDLVTLPNVINSGGTVTRAFFGTDNTPPTVPGNSLTDPSTDPTAVGANQAVGCGAVQPPAASPCTTATIPNFKFSAVDNLSGFSGTPVSTKMTRLNSSGGQSCVIGSGSSCSPVFKPLNPVLLDDTTGTDGYYTYTASIFDFATNFTALPARTALIDRRAPVMGGIQVPATLTGGQAANFSTNATDNVDLISSDFTLAYVVTPANAPNPLSIRSPGPALGVAFDNTLTTTATFSYTIPAFVRTINTTNAAGTPGAVGGATKPSSFTGRVYDGGSNQSAPSPGTITSANIPIPTSGTGVQTDFTAPQANTAQFCGVVVCTGTPPGWAVTNAVTSISNCTPAQCPTPAHPSTVNLTAQASGNESGTAPAFQFLNPFQAGVSFYYNDPTTLEWILIGTVPAPSVSDNATATVRTFTWTFGSWDPPIGLATGVVNIIAVGVNTVGDGLATANNANITLTNP